MTADEALAQIAAAGDPARAAETAARQQTARPCFGTPGAVLDALARDWRATLTLDDRLALAHALWGSDTHEGRIAAAKLLTQARIRPDDTAAWALVRSWVPEVDGRAIAESLATAGQKRLVADPARIHDIEAWVTSSHLWTRQAALAMTMPWTRQNNPKPADLAIRDRVLAWCAQLAEDRDGRIQTAIATWLQSLSRHDAPRTRAFLAAHGARLKPFARAEAGRHLSPV